VFPASRAPQLWWLSVQVAVPVRLYRRGVAGKVDMAYLVEKARPHLAAMENPPPPVEPGSALAGDDAATSPLHISHAAWSAYSHGVDHLQAVIGLLERSAHPYAQYTLLRALLENAATSVWLLGPKSRNVRIERRLKLAVDDVKGAEYVQTTIGKVPPPPARTPAERRDEIRTLAAARGIDASGVFGRISYQKTVSEAAVDASLPAPVVTLLWRVWSGLAHGRQWASLGLLNREILEKADGTVMMRLTSDVDQIALSTTYCTLMLDAGVQLYDQRRQSYR
jgi:hypothetical protein